MFSIPRLDATALLALVALVSIPATTAHADDASATSGTSCHASSPLAPLQSDVRASFVDREIVFLARPGDETAEVAIDLLIRRRDAATGLSRPGTFEPHLVVRFEASAPSAPRFARGELTFRLTDRGPSHGVDLTLPSAVLPGDRVELTFEIDRRASAITHAAPASACPLPSTISASFVFDPSESPAPAAPEVDGEIDEDAVRVTLVGALDPRAPDDYNDIWGYTDGSTHLAIVGGENGTSFIDVTDPANPVEVGYVSGPNSAWRDIKTYGSYAYIGTEGNGGGIQVVDLSNPLSPTLVNTYTDTVSTSHNLYCETTLGHLYVVGSDNGTRILDVATDPANPVEIGSWTDRYVHDAYVDGDRAYFSEVNDGIQEILDASDVTDLQVLETWATPRNFTHNVWANDDQTIAVTTDEVTGAPVAVYDISDIAAPGPPAKLSEFLPNPATIPHNAILDDENDDWVAVSHYGIGLQLFDITNPRVPVLLGSYDTYPSGDSGFVGAWGVYPFDPRGYIYVSDIQTGLYVFRYDATGGPITGRITDASTGEPVAGAEVVSLTDGESATSSAEGRYGLYATAGPIELRVAKPGYRTRVVDAGTLALGASELVDVALERLPSGALTGAVISTDGSPVEGARVVIEELGIGTISAADGTFELPSVAVGGRMLRASRFGFSPAARRVAMSSLGVAGVTLELAPAYFADDAEEPNGWTLGIPEDDAVSGEWVRVDPVGTGGGTIQPENDATEDPGVLAFVTGQGNPGGSSEANDVDGGATTLVSPTIDLSGVDAALVRYQRWLSVDRGFFDDGGALRVFASSGSTGFQEVDDLASEAASWEEATFDLGSFVELDDQVALRFRAVAFSFDNLRIVEAGIDDVEVIDGCDARFNANLDDADGDERVDACDPCPNDPFDDGDGDGVCGDVDNAPDVANPDQLDADGDGIGDAGDLCPSTTSRVQRDLDGDGIGDACDDDVDGDGVPDTEDLDRDGDGVEGGDVCPTVPDARQLDADGDGEGDACDADDARVEALKLGGDELSWNAEFGADAYSVYRGDLGAAALVRLAACRFARIAAPFARDLDRPQPGEGFFYLVGVVEGGVEGSLGDGSAGEPRTIDARCPLL